MDVNMKKIVVIVGPTAVGKTALSIEIAKRFDGEIINGDAVQVFQGLNIGTAKITNEEMAGVPHHLIDICDPASTYNVFDFKKDVDHLIEKISSQGKLPIIVGGTGLYIQSVLYDYQFPEQKTDHALREQLTQLTPEQLYQQLVQLDEAAASSIHPNNLKRVIRALEICLSTGRKFSEQSTQTSRIEKYSAYVIGLEMDRETLYQRINARVLSMIEAGLEREVRNLCERGMADAQSMQAIGYKEFIPYFHGEQTIDEVIKQIQQHTRNFAKRQYTWFKNKMDIEWFTLNPDQNCSIQFQAIMNEIALFLGK